MTWPTVRARALVLALLCVPMGATSRESRPPDLVVVGAGIAGLAAALDAADAGAQVTVMDMWSVFGGHAVMSTGGLCIVG